MKTNTPSLILIPLLIAFALLQSVYAVVPPPDGGYPGFNTAEGTNALKHLTTGIGNAAVGWSSLLNNTDGSFNTALGVGTLLFNVGDQINEHGVKNTAIGAVALLLNTTGYQNTATGFAALENNTIGGGNNAFGYEALLNNEDGFANNAFGWGALSSNTSGEDNNAFGNAALFQSTGSNNTAIGHGAGYNLVTGDGNVYIGDEVQGENGVSNSTYIRNVYDSITTARQVYVDANNKIGTLASTRRVKDDIESMAKASETILALRPVTFRYKKEIDRYCTPQFGLVAEEVAEINPNLVTRDREGKPETVRYDAVNAMLLNEFLKEHRKVQELEAKAARQQEQIEALTAGLQKVSAELATANPSLADSR